MRLPTIPTIAALSLALLAPLPTLAAQAAGEQTVCTITVNSPDEKNTFRRHLPPARYKFVELVERGRSDWLSSACRAKVSCDVLVVSGHFDGASEFFSDQLDFNEHLPVAELERVSCSDSCPSLFSRLKEVYLFGCNTLTAQPQSSASAEALRALLRDARSPAEAQRRLQSMAASHGESSRNRMRQIFNGVPVIYGFSSVAPLGPVAASTLDRYLRTAGDREIGRRKPSGRLLELFAPHAMSVAPGMTDSDPHIQARRDMCRFADDRRSQADKLGFVQELLQRPIIEARIYLDRIERLVHGLDDDSRRAPQVARALEAIARDDDARSRFLGYARSADEPPVRVRMIDLARDLGWLGEEQRRDEIALAFGELHARGKLGVPEVNLACSVNAGNDLDGIADALAATGGGADTVAHSALRACLGSTEGRARTLQGLTSANAADVAVAQAYLRHRPVSDAAELRRLADAVTRMPTSDAQVRALDTLARHYISDVEVLTTLTRLFGKTTSPSVQSAIAGILVRADLRAIPDPHVARTIIEKHRLPGVGSGTLVDALILRLRHS